MLLAIKAGFQIEIICFEFNNWSKANNDQLIKQLGDIKIIKIDAGRKHILKWAWSILTEKIAQFTNLYYSKSDHFLSQAVSRRSDLIIQNLQNVSMPDLVIGHNPGAMWPTLFASKIFNCKAGFDVEDYHPGEGDNQKVQSFTRQLMIRILPKFDYVSFASPLILQQLEHDIMITKSCWFTILNYFPKNEFIAPINNKEGRIKMVWFSQNINAGRGLELILPLLKKYENTVELHLIGNLNSDFFALHLKNIANLFIHSPKQQNELHKSLAEFDIGLALEPAKDINNDLAVSNKILAYLQAGLYVIATETSGQKKMLTDWQQHGVCFDCNNNNLQSILDNVIDNIQTIKSEKNSRFQAFKNNHWETASEKLLKEWKTV